MQMDISETRETGETSEKSGEGKRGLAPADKGDSLGAGQSPPVPVPGHWNERER